MNTKTENKYPRNVSREEGMANLARLCNLLEALDPKRFDYRSFAGSAWQGEATMLACGTTACALGWATAIPDFGLALSSTCDSDSAQITLVEAEDTSDIDSWVAANSVFCLDPYECDVLFLPSAQAVVEEGYVDSDGEWIYPVFSEDELNEAGLPTGNASAKTVAAHIRKFIAADGIYQ